MDGREIDCVLFLVYGQLIVLPLTEIISKNDFFDYEAKYTSGLASEITPPKNLNPEYETKIKTLSSLIYNKLACKGIVRIDYILKESTIYFIEVNTIPGLSPASIVPQQAKAMGLPISELFDYVIDGMF